MNHNFKPGDLALIVADGNPENVGKCVELVELVQPGAWYVCPVPNTLPCGLLRNCHQGAVWVCLGDFSGFTNEGEAIHGFCQKSPTRLMPLRGDFAPERQKAQQVPA
ncbi:MULTISPECIES: hypothetical protein [unclassified Pseudomonas]|uniref:hypothetical protein n=1 Tax=unclassified Pseudomonas TaxID=196821 RepID=UPI00131DAADC|nr:MULTISPECIES: hypothetical protein [unclassified Pseudomonas]